MFYIPRVFVQSDTWQVTKATRALLKPMKYEFLISERERLKSKIIENGQRSDKRAWETQEEADQKIKEIQEKANFGITNIRRTYQIFDERDEGSLDNVGKQLANIEKQ